MDLEDLKGIVILKDLHFGLFFNHCKYTAMDNNVEEVVKGGVFLREREGERERERERVEFRKRVRKRVSVYVCVCDRL